jgi:ABC-type multidrug transport system ATPase subunit
LIKNLTKTFGNLKAINNINLSIKEGEVFAILGHNGAGKTTLINILTGMFSSTSGDAIIYGKSILSDLESIQRDIGFC